MSILSPQEAVQALVAAKWSESRIAKAAGTSQPTIHRLKRGSQKTVAFEVGAELIRLASGVASEGAEERGAA
jgi:IS30 family transposase